MLQGTITELTHLISSLPLVHQVMYTCDAFGMHYCTSDPYDIDIKAILPHYRFYFDCLMKPNAKSVTTALRKVKDLKYDIIANGHGPILRYNVTELVNNYGSWAGSISKSATSVAILYSSDYGFSDRLSQTLAKGVTKAGVQTEMVDLLSCDPQELVAVVGRSQGLILMSPPSDNKEAKASLCSNSLES
jgi:flavorubredoxin